MTTGQEVDAIEAGDSALPARLRPADTSPVRMTSRAAGPFEVASTRRKGSTVRDALVTGLLVIYPAFATVAAIVVSLVLAGGGA